ncbi:MAG: nucleotidyltransferase domain-containing protein [Chthonomonadetes bacterium]|nr:nucleotidyltransferase domain-containing protein [Chthonomonadetes bacterium]
MKRRRLPQNVRLALLELKRALVQMYGERLEGIYLYGSYARGDFTQDSDVDVLVVFRDAVKPGAEITNISPLVSDICLRYDVLFSIFPVSAEQFATRQSPFMLNVRREVVEVCCE